RRSQTDLLEIPPHRFYPSNSPTITCIWGPLIRITEPTEDHMKNLPPPVHQQDPDFLTTEYNSRLRGVRKPFELIEIPESFEYLPEKPEV
ncbi:hypothetical protein DFH28DRAFT_856393, partial [Melampsora americana]